MTGTLVGRDDELRQLSELVARQPLVTVTGSPGAGKTALVRELVARLAAEDDLATLWCSLGDLGVSHAARDVRAALADQLGFGSVESLHAALDGERHLIVFDGCELGPGPACDIVDELLEGRADLRVVATSRRPLGSELEYLWVLPPLPVPSTHVVDHDELRSNPAVRMYLDRCASAGSAQPETGAQLEVVASLVRELDGLPLGIELAAARARTLGPGDLVRRIDQQLDLLRSARGARASPPSLRASLDVAYEQLDQEEKALFRALSVFRGSVAGDLVHTVCAPAGDDELDTADRLGALVDASLVQAETGSVGVVRYRLLNVVRRYAADLLAEADESDAVEERCIARLADLADSFVAAATSSWSDELISRMLGCFHTLVGAVELSVRRDEDAARAIRLVLPLYSAVHGLHAAEVAALGTAVLDRWPDGDEPLRLEACAVVAAAHLFSGDAAAAGELAASVLSDAGASDLAVLLASRTAGFACAYEGDLAEAVRHLDRGVELASGIGGPFERELSVARVAVRAADVTGDDALVEEITALSTQSAAAGEPVNRMWCLVVSAHVLVRSGRLDQARAVGQEALDLADRVDHPWGRGSSLRVLAVVDALTEGWATSAPRWDAAVTVNVQAGDRGALAQTIDHACRAAAAIGASDVVDALAPARLLGATPTVLPPMLPEADGVPAGSGTTSMAEAARRTRTVLRSATPNAGDGVDVDPRPSGPSLVHDGDVWNVVFGPTSAVVRHVKGLDDLARLLAAPGTEIHCLDLMEAAVVEPDTGANVDSTARARYEERIRELQAELDEAAAYHDTGREELVAAELDALVDHLTRETALAGRDRTANATVERARAAVRWRLRAAIERLDAAHPPLGRHLEASIRTGAWCSYQPEHPQEWRIER